MGHVCVSACVDKESKVPSSGRGANPPLLGLTLGLCGTMLASLF